MTIRNVLLALALTTFTLAGCTQNTTFGISANVLAFVDEEDETGTLDGVTNATVDVLGADGIALSNLGISENQAADIETLSLEVVVDFSADAGNGAVTIGAAIYLDEGSLNPPNGLIADDDVALAAGEDGTLTLNAEIDSTDAANLEILQSGDAVIGVTLSLTGGATDEVTYNLQTVDLGGSYTPSDALTF